MPVTLDAYRTPDRLKARIALHQRFGDPSYDLHRWLFDLLTQQRPALVAGSANVLEVGAGTGRLWRMNADRVPRGWALTLTDRSEGMLEELQGLATTTLAPEGVRAEVGQADATALPYPDATFDLAFANHMLYHLSEPAAGVRELRRVLKPGALLVAATNGNGHMREASEFARRLEGLEGIGLTGVETLSFTCESGGELLAAEFESVELSKRQDELAVTDREALLAYVRSLVHLDDEVPPASRAALHDMEAELRRVPLPFRVGRATGVFFAN